MEFPTWRSVSCDEKMYAVPNARTEDPMNMLRFALIALCLPGTLAAEERSARFVELMTYLPSSVIANRSPQMPEFVDYEAASAVIDGLVAAGGNEVKPDARRSVSGPFSKAPQGGDWKGKVGFSRADLLASVSTDDPENRAVVVLLQPEAIARVGPTLLANGYALDEARGFPAFWRGKDDLGFDPALRDKDDPFAYPIPKSSRIAVDGQVVLQSPTWPMVEAMWATSEASPALTAFGRVLDLADWGNRQLIHATVFSDPMTFAPGFRIGKDLTPVDAPPGGVPYWSNLMLADLGGADGDLTLVVVIYTARSDAEAAAAAMEAGLGALVLPSFGDKTLADLTAPGRGLVTGDGPYAAVYAVETETDARTPAIVLNRGYRVLTTAAFSRELPLLGVALP
jgi:hypothetical protein